MVSFLPSVRRAASCIAVLALTLPNLAHGVAVPESAETPESSDIGPRASRIYNAVVGCSGNFPRRSINDFQSNHADTFTMLILALEGIQKVAETNDLSWYQIAGIHGYPFIGWQENKAFKVANKDRGYCEHSSSIFTTWHRPYLLLLEQQLCAQAKTIAARFNGAAGTRFKNAATQVRLPYWDWSSSTSGSRIPAVLKQSTITVDSPTGRKTIPNPLFRYVFQRGQASSSGLGTRTVRGPNDNDLNTDYQARRQATLDLFTVPRYNQFSLDLEAIHDAIHVGVGGHMGSVPRSAFDPIFFLHHTNVDRLMAMYQATHPGEKLTPAPRSPTYALGGTANDDLNTRLYPFRHPSLGGWRSRDVSTAESIFRYGYSYIEVPQGLSATALRTFTTRKVRELYGPAAAAAAAPANARIFLDGNKSGVPNKTTARLEWVANVQVPSNGLTASYRIRVFVGPGQADGDLAGVAAIFAGTNTPLSTPNDLVNASVPLTPKLISNNVALGVNATVSALKDDLSWSIERASADGVTFGKVPISALQGLVISVVSYETNYPQDESQLPTKSAAVTYYEPTIGKDGGLQPQERPKVGNRVGKETTSDTTKMRRRELVF